MLNHMPYIFPSLILIAAAAVCTSGCSPSPPTPTALPTTRVSTVEPTPERSGSISAPAPVDPLDQELDQELVVGALDPPVIQLTKLPVTPEQKSPEAAKPRPPRTVAPAKPKLATAVRTKLVKSSLKPKVVLSNAHQETCRKLVGDVIDQATVTDIAGTNHQLRRLLSDRLTVLIFWNEYSIAGMEQFRRIPVDVLGTFASHRVKVIAVNVGGDIEMTRNLTGDGADKIVSLADSDSQLFARFATSHVPRTYVLDKDGKILWFDIEYSQSTRRSLSSALSYFLTH